jgi:sugar-phosphatase
MDNEQALRSIRCKAILFDMDGTLVDSTHCVEAIWSRWAHRHGIEPSRVLSVSHGRRTIDTLREVAPHLDIEAEAMWLDAEEREARDGIPAIPGAAAILGRLPHDCWAVVTSAGRALAEVRLRGAELPLPTVLVSADDVAEGKPHPAGYRKAAQLLGVAPDQCLVIEDTPAGILAGRAANMQVLALNTTYPATDLLAAPCVRDFRDVRMVSATDGLELHLLVAL